MLEKQHKQRNLRLFNLQQQDDETPESLDNNIKQTLCKNLNLSESDIEIDNAYRINRGRASPKLVLVTFYSVKSRDRVLSAFRQKKKQNAQLTIQIAEVFFQNELQSPRLNYFPSLKNAFSKGRMHTSRTRI